MVGGNPPNHLGNFYEGIKIKALFSKGQCGPCVVCGEEGLKEVEEDVMYFVCDFNGRWLKDLNLLCCMVVILSEEGRIIDIIQARCFIKLIVLYLFQNK